MPAAPSSHSTSPLARTALLFVLTNLLSIFTAPAVTAQEATKTDAAKSTDAKSEKPAAGKESDKKVSEGFQVETVVTLASVTTEDGKIDYSAHTGTLLQTADDGDEKAKVFFVAYTKVDAEQPKRPVTFC
ncbi:MAG: hypothetical protein AAF958_06565, partial [Planctomycetota bacterium]